MCGFAYVVSLIVYQLVGLALGEVAFGAGTIAAILLWPLLSICWCAKATVSEQEQLSARRSVSRA